MKNTFGTNISLTVFGESHGAEIGCVLDGLPAGLPVDEDFIAHQLTLRRPAGRISTSRQEPDPVRMVSGVFQGKTCGTPICFLIPNTQTQSKDYAATYGLARPGHADYTAFAKYHGCEDYRGGGHFSGRITAGVVAAGALALDVLQKKGIRIATHVKRCAKVNDRDFEDFSQDWKTLQERPFAVLDEAAAEGMKRSIEAAAANGDSVGGVLETRIEGLPCGVGEPWFDSVESMLSHALFGIPAVKGIEFGDGFAMADGTGSTCNDALRYEAEKVVTTTNHNGGLNGGITNGMPVVFRCAIKPTPSIVQPQDTIHLLKEENATLSLVGRHDPAIVHRARVVVDSMAAVVLCDLLASRFGNEWLREA